MWNTSSETFLHCVIVIGIYWENSILHQRRYVQQKRNYLDNEYFVTCISTWGSSIPVSVPSTACERSVSGAERKTSEAGRKSGERERCGERTFQKLNAWAAVECAAGGRHKNKLERWATNRPLTIRSHALVPHATVSRQCSALQAWWSPMVISWCHERESKFGNRALAVAGPEAWNSLRVDIRSSDTVTAFKNSVKTYLFKLSYCIT